MNILKALLTGAGLVVALGSGAVSAQEAGGSAGAGPVPSATLAPATVPLAGAAAVSGPKVYLADRTGQIGVLDMGTRQVTLKGNRGTVLTDIAFCPDGKLYGVTFTALYAVNTSNGTRTRIGSGFGNKSINSLVCNSAGQLFGGSDTQNKLFRINKGNGTATALSGTSTKSDGDLAHHEGNLWLSDKSNRLAKLNKTTGAVLATKAHGINDLFGLVSFGTDRLHGFAGTKAYKFTETSSGPTGGKTLLFDFAGKGLQQIYGAAYNGNFQN